MGMGALPRRGSILTLIMSGDRRPATGDRRPATGDRRPATPVPTRARRVIARDDVIASYRHIAVWRHLRLQRLSVRSIHYPGVLASPGPESARRAGRRCAGNSARASSTQ